MGAAILTFLLIFALVALALGLGFRYLETQRQKKLKTMLQTAVGRGEERVTALLVEEQEPSWLARLLERFDVIQKVEAHIQQAGMTITPGDLVMQMLLAAFVGGLVGLWLRPLAVWWLSALLGGLAGGAAPYLLVLRQRKRRLAAFEEQFPDALDFLARAMRAGHAFSISLEMLADESSPPLSVEIRKVFNEHNLGLPIDTALKNLAMRVPLLDVKFFVSAVLLQRETGGNLAEVLTKLARIIRERFQLKGQVRALSAHGRVTGAVLTIMPIVLMLGLMVVAPGYLQSMFNDPDGKYIVAGAALGVLLGHLTIRKIVDIKV
jgi:tight adherence protein B